jgi:hypothetical protein
MTTWKPGHFPLKIFFVVECDFKQGMAGMANLNTQSTEVSVMSDIISFSFVNYEDSF